MALSKLVTALRGRGQARQTKLSTTSSRGMITVNSIYMKQIITNSRLIWPILLYSDGRPAILVPSPTTV